MVANPAAGSRSRRVRVPHLGLVIRREHVISGGAVVVEYQIPDRAIRRDGRGHALPLPPIPLVESLDQAAAIQLA